MAHPMKPTAHAGVLTALGAALLGSPVVANITTTINPSSNRGSWEDWGVPLAGWGKIYGTRSDLADIFVTRNSVSYSAVHSRASA